MNVNVFLDASSHLYKRVSPSVGPSVGPSVCIAFVKIAENGVIQDEDASYVVYTALLSFLSFVILVGRLVRPSVTLCIFVRF